jgi:hypothetical protein
MLCRLRFVLCVWRLHVLAQPSRRGCDRVLHGARELFACFSHLYLRACTTLWVCESWRAACIMLLPLSFFVSSSESVINTTEVHVVSSAQLKSQAVTQQYLMQAPVP